MTSPILRSFGSLFVLAALLLFGAQAIASDAPSETEQVASAVRARLAQPDAEAAIHLDRVVVADGVARLTGIARTRFALAEAVRVVKALPGVRAVDVHGMRVEPNP